MLIAPHIQSHLNCGRTCLVIDDAGCRMAKPEDAFQASAFPRTIVALDDLVERCARLVPDRPITRKEMAILAGCAQDRLDSWTWKGICKPSVSENPPLFSGEDAFNVGLIAALRRHGVAMDLVRQVAEFIQGSEVPAHDGSRTLTS